MNVDEILRHSKIAVLDEVKSTNEELMALARAGAPCGSGIRARIQWAGRGRRTHRWSSPEGGLYLSILIKTDIPQRQLPGLPIACGIGVADALMEAGGTGIRLKWPNDVVVDAGKIGGILVEVSQSSGETLAVCGMGINLEPPSDCAREEGSLPVTGLLANRSSDRPAPSVEELAESVRLHVLEAVAAWTDGLAEAGADAAPLTGILEAYNELLAYKDGRVRVFSPDGTISTTGILKGIDPWGRALVERADGAVDPFDASRVSLRPLA
ncbi:MAG: biotin--[acetyl-CoA-carboxylase] ligase [Collinsella sp.]|nr:biotin--[acetyl-CoA-carboxylase] ligase [Collinsella sp.]